MLMTANTLRGRSLKATPQRIAIYDYLCGSKEHPTAEEIYEALRERFPAMSLSTVYKTVGSFKESGLVAELNAGEGSFRYDGCVEPHDHFYCLECRSLTDVAEAPGGRRGEVPPGLEGHTVLYERSYYYGVCPGCAKTRVKTSAPR